MSRRLPDPAQILHTLVMPPAPPPAVPAQPYAYRRPELVEPDWRRLPGWRDVTTQEWASAQWQRAHCVKNPAQLRAVYGDLVGDAFYADLERDQVERATMPVLLTPQIVNTFVPAGPPTRDALLADPVRRYMLPVFSDRLTDWPSHPHSSRDSLHEVQMWAVEGLTHRYPTKVLAELLSTCPQYCGHCTRMDLVGTSVPQVAKLKFLAKPADRFAAMLDYLRATPQVRDVVVSGGDVANLPWPRLEAFVAALLEVDNIRDIRLASKALMGLPQHWLADDVRAGMARLAMVARARGVGFAIHTHVNAAQLLDLCFALLDGASVTPYYFYLCDMIPNAEHWRVPVHRAQQLQHAIMGYLPGFATPRLVCDVPYVGKRWVHQLSSYDEVLGISSWTKNYRTGIERADADALERPYPYYDPIDSLPPEGQAWWAAQAGDALAAASGLAAQSHAAAAGLVNA